MKIYTNADRRKGRCTIRNENFTIMSAIDNAPVLYMEEYIRSRFFISSRYCVNEMQR